MRRKRGRPPKGEKPKDARLEIRVEPGEKRAYDEAAKREGLERSDWIRATLNAAAERAVADMPTRGERGNRTQPASAGS